MRAPKTECKEFAAGIVSPRGLSGAQ